MNSRNTRLKGDGPPSDGPESSQVTRILCCSQSQTDVSDAGDVVPSTTLGPITPPSLEVFVSRMVSSSTKKCIVGNSDEAPVLLSTAHQLRPLIGGQRVVAVVPLAATTPAAVKGSSQFLENLTLFLFHPLVGVTSLIVISDVLAAAVAAGKTDGTLIAMGTSHHCCIAYVADGCATRYSAIRWSESLHAAAVKKKISAITLDDVAVCRSFLIDHFGSEAVDSLAGAPDAAAASGAEASSTAGIAGSVGRLLEKVYRPHLLPQVIVAGEALTSPVILQLLKYVVSKGPSMVNSSGDTFAAEEQVKAAKLLEQQRGTRKRARDTSSMSSGSSASGSSEDEVSSEEEDDDDDEEDDENDGGTSEDEDDDDDDVENDDGRNGSGKSSTLPADTGSGAGLAESQRRSVRQPLKVLPSCPASAPWLMPLIGGSIVGQLASQQIHVRTLLITEEEVENTHGKVVLWKALL